VSKNNGMALEDEVYSLVESMLENGKLPYRKELTRLRRKARYYSHARKADVDFENALEIYLKDSINAPDAKPTHVIFFECKDHGRNVEVGRIDEVVGRLNGSFGFNMKAYFVTRKGFSSGALQTANSNGIGLIKIMPDDKVHLLIHMITEASIERRRREFARRAQRSLYDPNYISDGEDFYAMDDGYLFGSFPALVSNHLRRLNFIEDPL
jgi:hypothetical protein